MFVMVLHSKLHPVLQEVRHIDGCGSSPRILPAAMLRLRVWPLAAAHAFFTGFTTLGAVLLVVRLRPSRPRVLPFYSDASHADPERVFLSVGENLACLLLPFVILAERLQHIRLLRHESFAAVQPWRGLKLLAPGVCARVNFAASLCTLACFFVTANVPSKYPWTPLHQVAASGLILFYAVQASCKMVLARVFRSRAAHPAIRAAIAAALWAALFITWVCFAGRVATKREWRKYIALRAALATGMASVVHVATVACVALMVILARDLQNEVLVIDGIGPVRGGDGAQNGWLPEKELPTR